MSGMPTSAYYRVREVSSRWSNAWSMPAFRWPLILASGILILLGTSLGRFFHFIQARDGKMLDDAILQWLPAYNLSFPILLCIYIPLIYILLLGLTEQEVMWKFLVGISMIHILRVLSIYFLPLNPPVDLIPLYDPMGDVFYAGEIISKDLFFSGHTATAFWVYFCLPPGRLKSVILCNNMALMVMLLVQHVHYTIDLFFAILIAMLLHYLLEYFIHEFRKNSKWLDNATD